MTFAFSAPPLFGVLAFALHLASIRRRHRRAAVRANKCVAAGMRRRVSIIRPVCGIENFIEETLRSAFTLDYPRYEILFCAASAHDPVVPLVRAADRRASRIRARLLIGDERISANPKLNNVFKGWRAAATRLDRDRRLSNVLMPPRLSPAPARRLASRHRPGLLAADRLPPDGFWAEIECAFLNTYQARWQYFADTLGLRLRAGQDACSGGTS